MGKPDKSEDAYKKSARNKGRLILKNDEKYKKKKKKEKKRLDKIANPEKYAKEPERDDCAAEKIEYKETEEFRLDKAQHFGWWRAEKIDVIKDECIIEFEEEPFRYVLSNDDGTFCLGNRTGLGVFRFFSA